MDILISCGTRILYAVECKYRMQFSNAGLSGLKSYRESHPDIPCLIAAPVEVPQKLSFAKVIPADRLFGYLK